MEVSKQSTRGKTVVPCLGEAYILSRMDTLEATFKFNDRRYVEWPEKIDEDRSKSESKTSVDHMAEDIIEELYDGDEIVVIDKVIDGEEENHPS